MPTREAEDASSSLCSKPPFVHQEQVLRIVLSWIPPKVTMLDGNQWRKFYRQKFTTKNKYERVSWPNYPLCCSKLSSLMLSLMLENGWQASLPLKVFSTESQGEILVRGEGCNTLGVSHKVKQWVWTQVMSSSDNELWFMISEVVMEVLRSNLSNWVPT